MGKSSPLFPYFGGKRAIAREAWKRFGDWSHYREPFAGGLAVALAAPDTVIGALLGDVNAEIANVWRAVRYKPEAMAAECRAYGGTFLSEVDYHAWHAHMLKTRGSLIELMDDDIEACDPVRAYRWAVGQSSSIGKNWLKDTRLRSIPQISSKAGICTVPTCQEVESFLIGLSVKLSSMRATIVHGDWTRSVYVSPNKKACIFLDPPYPNDRECTDSVYAAHDNPSLWWDVRAWAIDQGGDPLRRIILCGYDAPGTDMPDGWTKVSWKINGGFGNKRRSKPNSNRHREVLWCSPHCLQPDQ